jgi:Ca2+-binding RTX toxin-like protein
VKTYREIACIATLGLAASLSGCSAADSTGNPLSTLDQALTAPAWRPGTSYALGTVVSYQGKLYRAAQAHTSAVGWEPPNVPALWTFEGTDTGTNVNTGPSGPDGALTLDYVTLQADCDAFPQTCCSRGATRVTLSDGSDTRVISASQCTLALAGADTITVNSSGNGALNLGPGNDTAMAGAGNDFIWAGFGDDTINAHGGTKLLFGNWGDDTIHAANGDNTVVPGPGADRVALGTGNDTVYIFDACELAWGETLDGGSGSDTLYTPVPLAELQARGVVVTGFERVIVQENHCRSQCAAHADCSPAKDSDCDGATDFLEQSAGLDPRDPSDGLAADPDGDGVPSREEIVFGGNPRAADSDGDGLGDSTDLIAGTDLDGDGKIYSADNCPTRVNPGQQDADHDGVGDACDGTPEGGDDPTALVALWLYRSPGGDAALAPPGAFDTARLRTDLKGLYQTDVTVSGFQTTFGSARKVTELYHPAGAHAYAISDAEKASLTARGYQEVGTLGYFAVSAPALGLPVQVRRFARTISGHETHAFALSASAAQALVAEGFTEIAALGYGLQNEGALVRSSLVVRYQDGASHDRYRLSALSEPSLAGWTAVGRQFRVFAQGDRWTVPIYRLVDASGVEALTLAGEVAGLKAQGYAERGILGYAYPPSGAVQNVEPIVALDRVTGAGRPTVYTADADEVQRLLVAGYSSALPVARVVGLRGRDRYRQGQACVGEQPIEQRIRATYPGASATELGGNVLFALGTACTIERLTTAGTALSPPELTARTKIASFDPISVQTARVDAERILALTPAQRASLLGPLASMDPGTCQSPTDWNRLGQGIITAKAGAINPRSQIKLRAPQCEGVTYGPGDRAEPGEATRAVTASTVGDSPTCTGEHIGCDPPVVGALAPAVYGVLSGAFGLPDGGASEQWAAQHGSVGLPVGGISEGACSAACTASLGAQCVDGMCLSYPVATNHQTITLSGANFWDYKTAKLRLTRVRDGMRLPDIDVAKVDAVQLTNNADRPGRCDPFPVAQTHIGVLGGPPVSTCTTQPCLDPVDRQVHPNEKWNETITALISVPDAQVDEFYTVQVVNQNGSYIPQDEPLPFDLDELGSLGHTIHVCTAPQCTPQLDATDAACSQLAIPACTPSLGGVWTTPPRSLSECQKRKDESHDPMFSCPETPFEFVSPAQLEGGSPIQIYISSGKPRFIQTRLSKVHCNDETGWDAAGDDELVVSYGTLSVPDLAIGDVEASADVFRTDINSGDNQFPEKRFTSSRNDFGSGDPAAFMLQVGEDDDIGAAMVITTIISAGLAGGASYAGGAGIIGILQAGGGAGLATFIGSYAASDKPFFDPDDFIGRDGWFTTSDAVASLGLQSHSPPFDPVAAMPQTADRKDLSYREGGNHPAVDGKGYDRNQDVRLCTLASDCGGARSACRLGACVQEDWSDKSLPVPFDPTFDAAGTMEHMRMNGDADYEFWVSTSVSAMKF